MVFKRSYKHFSQDQFINDLKLVPFWLVESTNDPNEALSMFNDLFMDIVNIHVPLKKFKIKAKPSPWLTDRIRELMKMRDAAKFEAKKSGFLIIIIIIVCLLKPHCRNNTELHGIIIVSGSIVQEKVK